MTILEYSPEELIREMDLKNILIDYHYEVNQEYQNFDDIENEEEMIAYITEMTRIVSNIAMTKAIGTLVLKKATFSASCRCCFHPIGSIGL